MDTASDGVFAYSEAQILATAIEAYEPGATEITLQLTGTQAIAVRDHMVNAAATNPDSVSTSLINQLNICIRDDIPFPMHISAQFNIDTTNTQIEPYPVIPASGTGANVTVVPHRIEIKFYLLVTASDTSGQIFITRDADDMITSIVPREGYNVTSITDIDFPAAAGSTFTVNFANPALSKTYAIPALADFSFQNGFETPTNLRAFQLGLSSIQLYWTPPAGWSGKYKVIVNENPETGYYIFDGPASGYVITNLNPNLQYTFQIATTDGSGRSNYSTPPTYYYPVAAPCFPAGTRILTPTGYRIVDELRSNDIVTTADGRTVSIKMYSGTFKSPTERDAPYLIPAHCYGHRMPPADLRLSPLHAFQTKKGLWHAPRYAFNDKVKQYGIGIPITYYHIECPNYFRDNLIVDGCVVESYAGDQVRDVTKIFTFSQRHQAFIRSSGEGNRNEPQQQSK